MRGVTRSSSRHQLANQDGDRKTPKSGSFRPIPPVNHLGSNSNESSTENNHAGSTKNAFPSGDCKRVCFVNKKVLLQNDHCVVAICLQMTDMSA